MQIHKLTTTNAFIITDLDGASQAAGIVRVAPKVLQGSAQAFARTATYTFALRELQVGGASAGISAEAEARDEAVAAFVAEVKARVDAGELVLDPGTGVTADDLADLAASDPRSPVRNEEVDGLSLQHHLEAIGPVIAAEAALGGLDGHTAAIEANPVAGRLVAELVARGATVVAFGNAKGAALDPNGLDADTLVEAGASALDSLTSEPEDASALFGAEASVLFCGSRQGMIDGEAAEATGAGLVVPTGCQPVSAKGLAVLRRRGIVALADFISTSGPTYAGWPAGEATIDAVLADATSGITEAVRRSLDHDEGPLLGACYRAEAFLSTWQEALPFGRPLA
ncbi:MAG: hypothetical protein U5K29_11395 [Acidimicrobiales bacterium]|nr:hypothetical protein [Acidimicrobiales bacterium]